MTMKEAFLIAKNHVIDLYNDSNKICDIRAEEAEMKDDGNSWEIVIY